MQNIGFIFLILLDQDELCINLLYWLVSLTFSYIFIPFLAIGLLQKCSSFKKENIYMTQVRKCSLTTCTYISFFISPFFDRKIKDDKIEDT